MVICYTVIIRVRHLTYRRKKKKEKDATVFMFISVICDTNDFPVHDLSGVLELGST